MNKVDRFDFVSAGFFTDNDKTSVKAGATKGYWICKDCLHIERFTETF
jgi:hypothetical protein